MRLPYPIFTSLDEEWRRYVRGREAVAALARWRCVDPVFCSVGNLDELLGWRFRDEQAGPDVVSLLVRFADEDPVAARVVLQAMLPGLVRLASRCGEGDPDAGGHILALAWERIRARGAAGRVTSAGSIVLDVRKRLLAERQALPVVASGSLVAPSTEDEVLSRLLVDAIAEEERAGTISVGSTELLVRTRVEGFRIGDVAALRGVSDHSLLQRRARAERRLRQVLKAA